MSYMPQGTVYGVLLNFRDELAALRPQMDAAPYKAPPQAPVLYIKTANTWSASGTAIAVPAQVPQVEVGATIAAVMGEHGAVAGYVPMCDYSVPHASFFRPPVRFKCLDGFLGIGPAMTPAAEAGDPASFSLTLRIDGATVQRIAFKDMVRNVRQLVDDVRAFMALQPGDVLLLGCDAGRPLARAGERVEIDAPGFAPLVNTLVGAPA